MSIVSFSAGFFSRYVIVAPDVDLIASAGL
jgi:hypothetical protein